jgi:hypothetical protein
VKASALALKQEQLHAEAGVAALMARPTPPAGSPAPTAHSP